MNAARALALWLGPWAVAVACASSPAAEKPVCNQFQFRACKAACGRGVQQCAASGLTWGRCQCVIVDASFETSAADGGSDAADGASDAVGDPPSDAAGR